MKCFARAVIGALALLLPCLAHSAGTLPIALTQQFSFTNCQTFTNACGTPLSGGLLYFYQVGTVATPQNSFQDTGLSIPNPNPLTLDANGRIPMFYLADGSIHVRLTDSAGVVQFDYPSMLVIGPSGGGGGGSSVDPTTIAATGDIKFRPTTEFVTGWVKLNGQTIGSATSGATGRANSDTQSLYTYLWTNCPDSHCPVVGGRGANGLADFNANKQLTLLDMRGRSFAGLDDMGASAAGRILSSNVTSGGGDGVTTPQATGGEANHTLLQGELPAVSPTFTGTPGGVTIGNGGTVATGGGISATNCCGAGVVNMMTGVTATTTLTGTFTPAGTISALGSGSAHNNMAPFMLGTWLQKL